MKSMQAVASVAFRMSTKVMEGCEEVKSGAAAEELGGACSVDPSRSAGGGDWLSHSPAPVCTWRMGTWRMVCPELVVVGRWTASSQLGKRCERYPLATACRSASATGVTASTTRPSPGPRRSWYRRSEAEVGRPSWFS